MKSFLLNDCSYNLVAIAAARLAPLKLSKRSVLLSAILLSTLWQIKLQTLFISL